MLFFGYYSKSTNNKRKISVNCTSLKWKAFVFQRTTSRKWKSPWNTRKYLIRGFYHSSSVGKESTCNVGSPGSVPGWGRSPGEGIGYPLQYPWTSLVAQLVKNLPAMQETWVWSLGLGRSPGEGKGYPLQYSGLDNSMDYTYGAAMSWTQLSDFHFISYSVLLQHGNTLCINCSKLGKGLDWHWSSSASKVTDFIRTPLRLLYHFHWR